MKNLGNKGFAISGIVYSILVLFVLLVVATLAILSGRKVVLDRTKKDIIERMDEQDNERLDVDDYTKKGLIIHYDGKKNTRSGTYNSSANKWENLVSPAGQYDGTLVNSPSWNGGDGLLFNGSNYVDMGTLNISGSVTFEIVVKYTNNKVTSTLIGNLNQGGYSLDHQYNPFIDWNYEAQYANHTLSFYNSELSSTQSLSSANETKTQITCENGTTKEDYIYSLTGVINEEQKKLYIYENGMQFESTLASLSLNNSTSILSLGAKVVGSNKGNYLRGKIYSVRVYDRALESFEVYKNYSIDRSRFNIIETC